ncbi:hypothetical protein AB9P05_23495 [Roseivirga sp. BDSF3-8]|uniref:hypothetical protein n=1 Tax=Roseivirga sp. BDSF3-8 TaxID=3241598 RepID=UPI003531833C
MTTIPHRFFSSATEKPFEHCIECKKSLLSGEPYLIQKSYRRYPDFNIEDTVFEFAMCFGCFEGMRNRMSRDSLRRMDSFFSENARIEEHLKKKTLGLNFSLDHFINNCIIEDIPIEETEEFQLVALCEGYHLSFSLPPYAISGQAMERMAELLSAETLDEMDDFRGRHFTGPPELSKLLNRKPILI